MLKKSSFWRLKPGSEVFLDSNGLGFTKGGSIKIDRVFEEMDNQKYGIIGAKQLDYTATITLNLYQYDGVTADIIFGGNIPSEPTYYTLKVTYVTRDVPSQDQEVEFKKVYVFDTGEITTEGRADILFPVTFKAIKDTNSQLYSIPDTDELTT